MSDPKGTAPGNWRLNRPFTLTLGCLSVALTTSGLLDVVLGRGINLFPAVNPVFCVVFGVFAVTVARAALKQPSIVRWTYLAGSALLALTALNPWLHERPASEIARAILGDLTGVGFLVGTWPYAPASERAIGAVGAVALLVRPFLPREVQWIPLLLVAAVLVYAVSAAQSLKKRVEAAENHARQAEAQSHSAAQQ